MQNTKGYFSDKSPGWWNWVRTGAVILQNNKKSNVDKVGHMISSLLTYQQTLYEEQAEK